MDCVDYDGGNDSGVDGDDDGDAIDVNENDDDDYDGDAIDDEDDCDDDDGSDLSELLLKFCRFLLGLPAFCDHSCVLPEDDDADDSD